MSEEFSHEFSDALDRRSGHLGGDVGTVVYADADFMIDKINPPIPEDAITVPK